MEEIPQKQMPTTAQGQPQQEAQPQEQQKKRLTKEQKKYALVYMKQVNDQKAKKEKRNFDARRDRVKDMLAPENKDTPVVIASRKEYLAMDLAYKSMSNKTVDEDSDYMTGYPTTDADWVARTAELTAAINDYSDILDKPKGNATDPETNTAVKAVKSLSQLEIQLLAGKILVNTCDAHRGQHNFPSWPKTSKQDDYANFNLRCQGVCRALAHSKALVKSVMDGEFPFAMRFAVAPESELKLKDMNGRLNRKRAESTSEMKREMKKKMRMSNDGNGKDDPQVSADAQAQTLLPDQNHDQLPNAGSPSTEATGEVLQSSNVPLNEGPTAHISFTSAAVSDIQPGEMDGPADHHAGASRSRSDHSYRVSPAISAGSQELQSPAEAIREQDWHDAVARAFSPVDTDDSSEGMLEEVLDDFPLFDPSDFLTSYGDWTD